MADDEKLLLRFACDRCHKQKLRCPKRPGVETCDRCAKARTSCVHSPIRRKVRVLAEPIPAISPTSLLPYGPYGKLDEPIGTNQSPTNVFELKGKSISTPPRTASQSFSLSLLCLISNFDNGCSSTQWIWKPVFQCPG
jgi:hypothetical protein